MCINIVPILSNSRFLVFHLYLKQPCSERPACQVLFAISKARFFVVHGGCSLLGEWVLKVARLKPRSQRMFSSNKMNFEMLYVYLYSSLWPGICQFQSSENVAIDIYILTFKHYLQYLYRRQRKRKILFFLPQHLLCILQTFTDFVNA